MQHYPLLLAYLLRRLGRVLRKTQGQHYLRQRHGTRLLRVNVLTGVQKRIVVRAVRHSVADTTTRRKRLHNYLENGQRKRNVNGYQPYRETHSKAKAVGRQQIRHAKQEDTIPPKAHPRHGQVTKQLRVLRRNVDS